MKHDRLPAIRDGSILTRKRFQFASALVIGALVPWLLRGSLLPGEFLDPPVTNTFFANAIAVVIAFWMRLSVETYPGIRRSYVILPSALTGHGLTIVWFLEFGFTPRGILSRFAARMSAPFVPLDGRQGFEAEQLIVPEFTTGAAVAELRNML